MKPYLKIIALFVCWQITTSVYAQKQPSIQQVSVYAPDNNPEALFTASADKFQAYNKGNHLYYTIANDDSALYLVAHTDDKLAIQKIVRWGLTLTVDNSRKISPGSPSVSFPVPNGDQNFSIIRTPEEEQPSKASYNAKMANICKLIAVKGLTGIDGPTISVYNTDGIKAKGLFNDQLEYTYELKVPLKYLNISVNDKNGFWYDVRLNSGSSNIKPGTPPPPVVMRDDGQSDPRNDYLFSPTNFGGACKLSAE